MAELLLNFNKHFYEEKHNIHSFINSTSILHKSILKKTGWIYDQRYVRKECISSEGNK